MQIDDSSSGPGYGRNALAAVPLFHAAWLFAAGIALTHWLTLRPSLVLIALTPVAVVCAIAAVRAQRMAWLPFGVLWLLLGFWCAAMEPQPAPAPALAALSDGMLRTVEGTVTDAGPLRSEAEEDAEEGLQAARPTQRIDLRVVSVEVVTDEMDRQEPVSGGVRLTIRWPQSAAARPLQCGETLRAFVRPMPPEIYHDPDVWSREDYLLDQGITSAATVNVERVERLSVSPGWFPGCRLGTLQHAASARILALPAAMHGLPALLRLDDDDAIMLAAMVTGDRTYLTHSLRVGFERTGSFHMLVVSGFHLAIVAGCILWLARRMRIPRIPATLVTIAASFAFALFTGFATPVQRSLWMVTLYLIGRLVYRDRSPLNTIGFAALCLLAASPRSLFESSLQMTLLAVIAIAAVAAPLLEGTIHPYVGALGDLRLIALDVKLEPRIAQFRVLTRMLAQGLQRAIAPRRNEAAAAPGAAEGRAAWLFPRGEGHGLEERMGQWMAWRVFPIGLRLFLRILELFAVSCAVELAMSLPMALYFHRITVFALPVNLFILPLLGLLMPAALLTLLALFLWPTLAIVPAAFAALVLHGGVYLVHAFGSLALGDFRIPAPLTWQLLAFCLLLAIAILLAYRALATGGRALRRLAWATLLLAAIAAVFPRTIDHAKNALLFEVIDVGQGDSLLLVTPEGKTLLVDAGGFGGGPHQATPDFDIGEEVVSAALWSRGIRRLDVVALSHTHSDHMGGMPAILRNFHPAELWVGNNPPNRAYNAVLAEAASLHIAVRSLRAGDALALGSARISVLAPLSTYRPGPEPSNDDSLVLRAAYRSTSVLLEGDAESSTEEAMGTNPELGSTVLKVGHHGSITSTTPAFLARVRPAWAAISCGLHNRYGHPRMEVLEELQRAGVRTFSTDITGASCLLLDGAAVYPDPFCAH